MSIQKLEFINLILFVFLFILSFFQDEYFVITVALCSVGIAFNVYLNFFKEMDPSPFDSDKDSSMNEKNAILNDLDDELKRRKKEDDFLRN
ncbi:MAG: hypothetical protein P8N49_04475 [Opitutales bacterium]|nr:hypothetical protein [Opitutales bacterium]